MNFALGVGGTITGQVLAHSGQPVENAHVTTTLHWKQPEHTLTRRSDDTEHDGRFILENLAPGEYRLTIIHPDFVEKNVKAVVKEGETSKVEVVLEE